MKKIILLILLPVSLMGQADYQTILPGSKTFYQAQEEFIVYDYYLLSAKLFRGVKIIDTIIENGHTTYKFFYEYNDDNYSQQSFPFPYDECLNMEAQCWLGPEVVVYDNGMNVFFNRYGDSLYIKTEAALNESWTFYVTDVGDVYNAVVTDISEKEFLGISELTKTITITGEGNVYTLEISKSHGFVKTINFRDFPGFEGDTYQVMVHNLAGMTQPELGYQPLTLADIYDYEVGDEIHRIQNSYNMYLGFVVNKVIDKELLDDDAVVYTFDQTYWWSEPGGSGLILDTVTDTITNLSYTFGQMPFESIDNLPKRYLLDIDSYNQRPRITTGNMHFEFADSCYKHLMEWDEDIYTYVKGVGLSEYHSDESMYSWSDKIVYFKKGDETWGTPLDPPTSINETEKPLLVQVFPNPAKDFIFIKWLDDGKNTEAGISVFDLTGKEVYKGDFKGSSKKIDVSNWRSGMYFYRISANGTLSTGKFTVSN